MRTHRARELARGALRWLRATRRRRRLRALLLVPLALWGLFWLAPRLLPGPPLSRGYSTSTAVYDARGRLLRLTLSADDQYRNWTPLAEISPLVVAAVLHYEDRSFRRHPGVAPAALLRGAWETYVRRSRRIGGSTITMQLARRLYAIDSSTLGGKLRQIGHALLLELRYTKDQLLEAYLNLAPYGGNVEGVAAASLIYFGKPAAELQLGEALTLAVIPQNPTARSPRAGRWPLALRAARAALLASWMRERPGGVRDALLAQLPLAAGSPRQLPFEAPHFVGRLLAERRGQPAALRATLDLDLQRALQRQLRAHVARLRRLGVRNAAALLVDHRGMAVRAAVGSADFFDRSIAGQVDGTRAKRSPGSTVKPLIYALGVEQGVIHPLTLLADTPRRYGDYRPENFDRGFAGPITAEQALVRSRNIPALEIAGKLSRPSLHGLLRAAGVRGLRAEAHYGLALALGGAELTMEELATLYGALANGGRTLPLRRLRDEPRARGARLLSAEASFVTLQMLRKNPRPDRLGAALPTARDAPTAYWKTGTSYGFRDAWTVGIVGPYVLAVWLGDFSGEANPALVGGRVAAPLFFAISDALAAQDPSLRELPPQRPPGVERVEVCSVSGQLPAAHCAHRRATWFIPGRSPIGRCAVHRQLAIETRTGRQACPPYAGPVREEVYEFWPSDLLALFKLAGIPRRVPPPPGASCTLGRTASRGEPPRISSPARNVTYAVRSASGASQRLPLLAATDADAREVFWFVDGSFVGKAPRDQPLLWAMRPGRFIVRAVDDNGRADARELRVERIR